MNDESYARAFNIKRKGNATGTGNRNSIDEEPHTGASKSKHEELNKNGEEDEAKTSLL